MFSSLSLMDICFKIFPLTKAPCACLLSQMYTSFSNIPKSGIAECESDKCSNLKDNANFFPVCPCTRPAQRWNSYRFPLFHGRYDPDFVGLLHFCRPTRYLIWYLIGNSICLSPVISEVESIFIFFLASVFLLL